MENVIVVKRNTVSYGVLKYTCHTYSYHVAGWVTWVKN